MEDSKPTSTLGNVRLRNHETNEIILVPAPSADPNDPLNWPQWYKKFIAVLVCFAMLWCNFLAAGPTVAIVRTTLDFFPDATYATDVVGFHRNIARVAYFFTSTSLFQGMGNFFWVPFANKYGRRPTYILSYAIYFACAIWAALDRTYGGFLAARILMGFGSGAAETLAPVTISDLFFLHERGAIMALYTSFLSVGVAFGMVISGVIVLHHNWRLIYDVASGFIGLVLLLAFFAFPETAFIRSNVLVEGSGETEQAETSSSRLDPALDVEKGGLEETETNKIQPGAAAAAAAAGSTSRRIINNGIHKKSYLEHLKLFSGTYTSEPFYTILLRPLGLICLPPVLWSALVQSVTIGFLVAVTSNVELAFSTSYNFRPWQVGLCFLSAVVGSIVGIPAGGQLGDWVADYLTKRNGGIREPEMRLPAMVPSLIMTPLALVLYGVGIGKRLHWMCPTVGLGLLNFSIVQGTNVCLVYVIDAYRPVAGEVTLAVMGFKSVFGFLLSFYTNPWVSSAGYERAFGTMAGIAFTIIILWVPLYIWGKRIRHMTWTWPLIEPIRWSVDREVGE